MQNWLKQLYDKTMAARHFGTAQADNETQERNCSFLKFTCFHSHVVASSSSEMTNYNTPDAFFLRPFLTRDEFEFWNSHFCRVPSSGSFMRTSNPKDTSAVTSCQHMTSYVTNAIESQCFDDRHKIGSPAVLGLSLNYCSNTRSGEMLCFPGHIPSSIATNCDTVNAKVCGKCPCSTNTSAKENGASLEKANPGNPCCLEHSVPCTSQTGQTGNHLDISTDCCDSTESYFVQQEAEPKQKEMYLVCADGSFGKKPYAFSSSGHRKVYPRTGSAALADSTAYGIQSVLGSTNCFPAKRKSISTSKQDKFPQGKKKRLCTRDEVNGSQQDQVSSKIVDSNETWNSQQSKRLLISGSHCKDARCKINDSRGMRKSNEITMEPVTDVLEENVNTVISGDSTYGRECKPGSKTFKETQPTTIDLTENISDVALKSRVWQVDDQIPNGRNKPLERKSIHEVIKTTKPVQRKLMTNDRTGGCAFDHDSLPRLIGVLSPLAIATVMSSVEK